MRARAVPARRKGADPVPKKRTVERTGSYASPGVGKRSGQSASEGASSVQRADDLQVRSERAGRVGHTPASFEVGSTDRAPREPSQDPRPPGNGKPLPEALRHKMGRSFGHDFSSVRIHEGPQAKALGAIAYTQGEAIHFAPGKFSPKSREGQELLGHELAHVVQQRAGKVAMPRGKGPPINADQKHEAEAEALGKRAAAGNLRVESGASQSGTGGGGAGGAIQRAGDPSLSNLNRVQRAKVLRRRAKKAKASSGSGGRKRNRKRSRKRNPNPAPPVAVPQPDPNPAPPLPVFGPQPNPNPAPPPVAAQQPNLNPAPAAAPVVPALNEDPAKEAWDESYEESRPKLAGALEQLGESAAGGFESPKAIGGMKANYWDEQFHPPEPEADEGERDVGEVGAGFSDILAGGAALPEQLQKTFGKKSDAFDRVSGGAGSLKALGNMGSGGMKVAKGFGAHGQGLTRAMADTGAVTSSLGLIGAGADAAKSLKGFQADKKRGKFEDEAQGGKGKQGKLSALARSGLRGTQKGLGLLSATAGTVKGVAGAVGGAAAPAVGAVAGAVGGGLGAVIGAGQMISGGHRLWLGSKRKKALAGVDAGGDQDKAAALEHLKSIQSKRQKKAGVDMAFGAGGIVSGALIASGVAAPVGLGLAAGLGLAKLGHMAFKGIRQWGRNKADKAAQGSRWRKWFNADKSTEKKKAKDLETAKTVLALHKSQGAGHAEMLSSLGLSHGNAFKKAGPNKTKVDMTDEEKLTEITKKLRKR